MDRPQTQETPVREQLTQRLEQALAERGMTRADRVLVVLRPSDEDHAVRHAVAGIGASVVGIDPSLPLERSIDHMQHAAPTWVIADSLAYVAGARTPLRRILRRSHGFAMPNLRVIPARHVHAGRRWPWLVPRHSLDLTTLCGELQ